MPDDRYLPRLNACIDFATQAGDLLDVRKPDKAALLEASTLLEDAAANAKSLADELEDEAADA